MGKHTKMRLDRESRRMGEGEISLLKQEVSIKIVLILRVLTT
jgi:hypothetical protein